MSRIRLHPLAFLVAAAAAAAFSVSLPGRAIPGTPCDLYGRIGWAHDDNLLRIGDDAPAFDDQRSDSWSTLEFGGVLDKTWGRQRLLGVAKLSKVNFDHFRQLDYDGKDFQGTWYWQLGNAFSGELGATYEQTLAPYIDFRSDERNLRQQRRRFFKGAWKLHPRWEAHAALPRTRFDYELAVQSYNDRTEDVLELEARYLTWSSSSVGLSNQTMAAYIAALARHDPVLIHAYPSSIAVLAAWLEREGRRYRGPSLRGVLTSSETLEPHARAAVERSFGAPVFDWYGQAERVAAIGTCERGSYHVLTDYGGVELLALAEGEGGLCEIVGTTLNNPAMPLQRYRTGDHIVPGKGAPCLCGRVFLTVDAVVGRQAEGVTLTDGRIVTCLDRVFQGLDAHIVEGQVLYRSNGSFSLRVVATSGLTAADEAALLAAFRLRVPQATVEVEQVAAIERGPNGKFAFLAREG